MTEIAYAQGIRVSNHFLQATTIISRVKLNREFIFGVPDVFDFIPILTST